MTDCGHPTCNGACASERKRPRLIDQFHKHAGMAADADKCWEWTGRRHSAGYGILYAEGEGIYAHRSWDEQRDARLYDGPWPVVAHPPCARWSVLWPLVKASCGLEPGDDAGCFEAALAAVRRFGGVLEHPALSLAWTRFGLPRPGRSGWTTSLFDPGYTTEVSQAAYGHRARKRTWLYYVGPEPPPLRWGEPATAAKVSGFKHLTAGNYVADESRRVRSREAATTPLEFRDVLLGMARTARARSAA